MPGANSDTLAVVAILLLWESSGEMNKSQTSCLMAFFGHFFRKNGS